MKPLQDPDKIIFAPIDDAENNFEDRGNEGVSAGVKSVIGVFLRMTEGASAVNYGNAVINLYTNLPEKIDRAVLSRIQSRTLMEGATSLHDFYDQDYIGLIRDFEELIPDFINLTRPANYRYLADQDIRTNLERAYEGRGTPRVGRVAQILSQVEFEHAPDSHAFFAHLDVAIKEAFPFYTSRDKRNIQSAVKNRLMDFDFPADWQHDADLFFRKNYDTKLGLIKDVMRGALDGKSFHQVFREEAISYFDNLARIADQDFERKVAQTMDAIRIKQEAVARLGGSL